MQFAALVISLEYSFCIASFKHIQQVKNGYTLVDPSGHPTTWGRWNPEYVNYNGSSHDDRGRQSLELVGYLLSAFRLTNCTLYLDAVHDLLSAHNQYDLNLINSVRDLLRNRKTD